MNVLTRMALRRAQMQWQQLDEHLAWCDERISVLAFASRRVI
jgi:hypothetical protein